MFVKNNLTMISPSISIYLSIYLSICTHFTMRLDLIRVGKTANMNEFKFYLIPY